MAKKQTKEEKALALTSEGICRAFEKAIPAGATTIHVMEAAATLIGSALAQMNATKRDLHNVFDYIESYVMRKVELKGTVENKNKKEK